MPAGTQIADVETRLGYSAAGSHTEVLGQPADALGQLHLHGRGAAVRAQGGTSRGRDTGQVLMKNNII